MNRRILTVGAATSAALLVATLGWAVTREPTAEPETVALAAEGSDDSGDTPDDSDQRLDDAFEGVSDDSTPDDDSSPDDSPSPDDDPSPDDSRNPDDEGDDDDRSGHRDGSEDSDDHSDDDSDDHSDNDSGDDSDDSDEDSEEDHSGPGDGDEETRTRTSESTPAEGETRTYTVLDVGQVTIRVESDELVLVDASAFEADGWRMEMESDEPDEVEVSFRSADRRVDWEAELEHGELRIDVRDRAED